MATVYAFSTENWNRDPIEVTTLMTIFAKYAETFVSEALTHRVKVKVLSTGKRDALVVLLFLFILTVLRFRQVTPKSPSLD